MYIKKTKKLKFHSETNNNDIEYSFTMVMNCESKIIHDELFLYVTSYSNYISFVTKIKISIAYLLTVHLILCKNVNYYK